MRAMSHTPLVMAHLGGYIYGRENALETVRAALAAQADIIEPDVRKSRTGYYTVITVRCRGVSHLQPSVCSHSVRSRNLWGTVNLEFNTCSYSFRHTSVPGYKRFLDNRS